MQGEYWVEVVGDMIVARLRGQPTIDLLTRCHLEVTELARESGKTGVLYDVLEMMAPEVDVPLAQRHLDASTDIKLKRAIVVPNTRLAYLARLAFGDGDYRVFYNDIAASTAWLAGARLLAEMPSTLGSQPAANAPLTAERV